MSKVFSIEVVDTTPYRENTIFIALDEFYDIPDAIGDWMFEKELLVCVRYFIFSEEHEDFLTESFTFD